MLCADYVKYNKTDINFTCSPAVFKGDKNKIMPVDESTFNAYLDAFEAFTPHRMAATVGFYGPSIQSADILTFQEVSNVELLTSLVKDLGFEPVAQQRKGRVDEAWWPMDFACIFARPELSFKQRCTFEYINEKDWLELNGGKPIAAAYSDVLDISVLSVHLKHGQTKDLLRRLTNNGFDMLIVGDFIMLPAAADFGVSSATSCFGVFLLGVLSVDLRLSSIADSAFPSSRIPIRGVSRLTFFPVLPFSLVIDSAT